MKKLMWASSVCLHPRRPTVSLATSEKGWPAERGRWLTVSTPSSWGPIWSTAFKSGASSMGKMWSFLRGSRGGPQRWSSSWQPFLKQAGWNLMILEGPSKPNHSMILWFYGSMMILWFIVNLVCPLRKPKLIFFFPQSCKKSALNAQYSEG